MANTHSWRGIAKLIAPVAIFAGLGLIVAAMLLGSPKSLPLIEIVPTRTGQAEACLTCHHGIEPISPSHSIEEFGCVSCHGGRSLATSKTSAHTGMIRNPAALDKAQQYCGECHAAQVVLVPRTLMATYAGAISLIRRTFGLQPDGIAQYAIKPLEHLQAFQAQTTDPQPVQNFEANCLTCHLNGEAALMEYQYRSTGCASCHVLYNKDGLYQGGDPAIPKDKPSYPTRHTFTTAIPYTQCNHCHNRGNYDLRTMQFVERTDLPAPVGLTDKMARAHEYYQPIGQFTLCEFELDCIDCHTAQQVMGDGVLYNNWSEVRGPQCQTCHGTLDSVPKTYTIQAETDPAILYSKMNTVVEDVQVGTTVMADANRQPLWNITWQQDHWVIVGKATGMAYTIPLVKGTKCAQKPEEQASRYCHECHAFDRTTGATRPSGANHE